MIRSDDPLALSLLFHLNSEPWLNERDPGSEPYSHDFKIVAGTGVRATLPPPKDLALAGLIRSRRSARAYREGTMPLASLSALLAACYGIVELSPMDGGGAYLRRSVPSAGGLYPLEAYLVLRRIEGMADGLYHYDVRGHALTQLRAGDLSSEVAPCFLSYPFVGSANFLVCLAAMFPRLQNKYGARGYRYILLEAGHAAQNLCLAAAEIGCASLCMGGFFDSGLNRLLGLDPLREGAVYAIAVGLPP